MRKKALSLFVAVCMVISLIPTIFAAIGTTYDYEFNPKLITGSASGTGTNLVRTEIAEETDGEIQWVEASTTEKGPFKAYMHKWGICSNTTEVGQWFALKINIPESGIYSASLLHAQVKSNGGIGKIYLLPGNTTDIASALLSATHIGEVSFYNSESNVESTQAPLSDVTVNSGEEGEYILVFYASEKKGGAQMYPNTLSLTKKAEAPVDEVFGEEMGETVKFAVMSEENGSVSVDGDYKVVDDIEIGKTITATATPNIGYTFAYWRNASGAWLSSNATETFKINTNTSVIAVYDKIPAETDAEVPVHFYNGNGSLIESKSVEKGSEFGKIKIANPTLTGFVFDKWNVADDAMVNTLTRAVALYAESDETYSVNVGDYTVAEGKKYGESATVSSNNSNFTCWKLGEDVVSYDRNFTFNVYGDIMLTEVLDGETEALPTVALDVKDGEYFITYNVPDGYTKIEAGILFGDGVVPKIGSFNSKASEKTGSGQFTAKSSGREEKPIARGYLLFKDTEGTNRVIYTSVYEG